MMNKIKFCYILSYSIQIPIWVSLFLSPGSPASKSQVSQIVLLFLTKALFFFIPNLLETFQAISFAVSTPMLPSVRIFFMCSTSSVICFLEWMGEG